MCLTSPVVRIHSCMIPRAPTQLKKPVVLARLSALPAAKEKTADPCPAYQNRLEYHDFHAELGTSLYSPVKAPYISFDSGNNNAGQE